MAKAKTTTAVSVITKGKKKRPGVHSKKKFSYSKKSKNYTKLNRGQGR